MIVEDWYPPGLEPWTGSRWHRASWLQSPDLDALKNHGDGLPSSDTSASHCEVLVKAVQVVGEVVENARS